MDGNENKSKWRFVVKNTGMQKQVFPCVAPSNQSKLASCQLAAEEFDGGPATRGVGVREIAVPRVKGV